MLEIRDSLPDGLLERAAADLHEVLAGPTLIHLRGAREPALFVSVLLHGNETTGWEALRVLLARHREVPLPRSLSLLIGNVHAARAGLRRLDGQPDFNRIWRGDGTPWHEMAARVLGEMRARGVFAAVDLHNTTGRNPHYAVACTLGVDTLYLASRFSRRVVHSSRPDTVLAGAFAGLAPAVTAECGQPGHEYGAEHALQFVEACLALEPFAQRAPRDGDLDLYRAVAIVKVPPQVGFGFGRGGGGIRLAHDLDTLNFHEVPRGTRFASVEGTGEARLEAWSHEGREVADRYFAREGDAIVSAVPLTPSMLTLDERAIRQDCLCYLMERCAL